MATKIKTEETLGYQADMNFYAFCIFSYGRKLYRFIDVVREPINGNPYNCKKIVFTIVRVMPLFIALTYFKI